MGLKELSSSISVEHVNVEDGFCSKGFVNRDCNEVLSEKIHQKSVPGDCLRVLRVVLEEVDLVTQRPVCARCTCSAGEEPTAQHYVTQAH